MKTIKKLILIFAALLVMASCGRSIRFERIGNGVVYDKTTNVEYYKGAYGNMCVLVDKDGKPLIYKEK